jgi:hypothetical protein
MTRSNRKLPIAMSRSRLCPTRQKATQPFAGCQCRAMSIFREADLYTRERKTRRALTCGSMDNAAGGRRRMKDGANECPRGPDRFIDHHGMSRHDLEGDEYAQRAPMVGPDGFG